MSEKVLSLVSGGIDSPLACSLVSSEFEVVPLTFFLFPMTSKENSLKTIKALNRLKEAISFEEAIILPWAGMLREIRAKIENRYTCVACRQTMLRAGEYICNQKDISAIVTGESLGQKASQTMDNIAASSSNITVPIIRPLIGLNKNEIVQMSRDQKILEEDHSGCCQATPNKPVTMANRNKLEEEVSKIDFEKILKKSYEFSISLKEFEEIKDSYFDDLEDKYG